MVDELLFCLAQGHLEVEHATGAGRGHMLDIVGMNVYKAGGNETACSVDHSVAVWVDFALFGNSLNAVARDEEVTGILQAFFKD